MYDRNVFWPELDKKLTQLKMVENLLVSYLIVHPPCALGQKTQKKFCLGLMG
jgi:hypothetical protein